MLFYRCLFALFLFVSGVSVQAASPNLIPAAPNIAASSYILLDADSGKVIVEKNADERLSPASLTKVMTSYVADYEIAHGNIHLDDDVRVSTNAWAQKFPGSSVMFLEPGKPVTVEQLLKGIDIVSGNDATVAIAEHIAGSVPAFVDLMNQHAQLLGLKNTHFMNPHGLTTKNHYSSARDLSIITRATIKNYPERYQIYSQKQFTYNGIRQPNRNRLLWRDDSVDGVKTGHTDDAGFCLIASAVRDQMRLIAVVMGTKSDEARFQETEKLLSYGFRYYKTAKLYSKAQVLAQAKVWGGKTDSLPVIVADDVYVTVPHSQESQLKANLSLDQYIQAGVEKGQVLGEIVVSAGDQVILKQPVIAGQSIEKGNIFTVLWSKVELFFVKLLDF